MLKGKLPVAGFILLGLSVMISILMPHSPTKTTIAAKDTSKTSQPHSPTKKLIAAKYSSKTSQPHSPTKTPSTAKDTSKTSQLQPPTKTPLAAKDTSKTSQPHSSTKKLIAAKDTSKTSQPQPPTKKLIAAKDSSKTSQPQPQQPQPSGKGQQPPSKKSSVKPPSQGIDLKSLSKSTHLVIKLRDRRVYVYQKRKLKVSYPIAVGKAGWETPTGNYKVMDMQRDPVWEEPWTGKVYLEGPQNPLGSRWIGFWTDGRNSIGFHGTYAEKLVGQAVSHGCIRMRNRDIAALFEQVKIGTPVTVKP